MNIDGSSCTACGSTHEPHDAAAEGAHGEHSPLERLEPICSPASFTPIHTEKRHARLVHMHASTLTCIATIHQRCEPSVVCMSDMLEECAVRRGEQRA